jgi:hypothetical protein
MVLVARKLTTLVPAMFMETASKCKRKKKPAENQTASVVKKTTTLNMGTKIAQALAEEPPVSRATMASLIDKRIKKHEKQSAKNIAAEAQKNLREGVGQNRVQQTKHQTHMGKSEAAPRTKQPFGKNASKLSTTLATPMPTTAKHQPVSATRELIPVTQLPAVPAPNPTTFSLYPWTPMQSFRGRGRGRGRGPQQGSGRHQGFRSGSNNV